MSNYTLDDRLHRLSKYLIDNESAASIEEASAVFESMHIQIIIADGDSSSPAHQAALLTCVSLGSRVFLGGVYIAGNLDVPLCVPMPFGTTLGDAVSSLGGLRAPLCEHRPSISIGGLPIPRREKFHVRACFSGWRAGVLPADDDRCINKPDAMPLAPMLAAALAINQAFHFVSGESEIVGNQSIGLSLWDPHSHCDWLKHGEGPWLEFLPSRLWLIGLGHLGQAYLWALGLLPYANAGDTQFVLQDTDIITPSTTSTSVLSRTDMVGQMKTRAIANWAEKRGFKVNIQERLFDDNFKRQESEPSIALCGIDNAFGRRALDLVGFQFVVEVGLGASHRNFRSMRLHTLPGPRRANEIWSRTDRGNDDGHQFAYQKMLIDGVVDQCGIAQLAGKAVGAPFVGSVAACLAVSEVLRVLHGGQLNQLIELNLLAIEQRVTIAREKELTVANPGFTNAIAPSSTENSRTTQYRSVQSV